MKRSEMIRIIQNEMSEFELISDYWPEKILSAIEKAGMLPPTRNNKNYSGWQSEYSDVPSKINDWEPEDDNYCGAV